MLCVKGCDCPPIALHVQLPTLERLHLQLQMPCHMEESEKLEMVANTGQLPSLGGLTALALEVGVMHGMLRHLQLPPGIKVGFLHS